MVVVYVNEPVPGVTCPVVPSTAPFETNPPTGDKAAEVRVKELPVTRLVKTVEKVAVPVKLVAVSEFPTVTVSVIESPGSPELGETDKPVGEIDCARAAAVRTHANA